MEKIKHPLADLIPIAALLLLPGVLLAGDGEDSDEEVPKFLRAGFVEVSVDSISPMGASRGPLLPVETGGVAAGFRPLRFIQVDAFGLSVLGTGMASNGRSVSVTYSDGPTLRRQIDDNSVLFTTGARLVLPVWRERLLFSAGGGWAGLFVNEYLDSGGAGSGSYNECYSCRSRRGWGPTAIAEVLVFPHADRQVGIGFHVRTVQIYSNGLSFRKAPSPGVNDRFVVIGGTMSFRFAP